jgi:Kef-type K+ transport system membrane component KefB
MAGVDAIFALGPVVFAAVDAPGFENLLFVLAATLVATRLLGALAQRMGQPAVLGELIAGVLLGTSVLGIFNTHHPVLHAFAELGVIVLLFQIGLHTDLRALGKVGSTAITVGVVGVVLPFFGGVFVSQAFGIDFLASLVVGAALTATSIGISARVLGDLGQLKTPEGQVVIGAAVFDDVVGLIILSIVASMVAGTELSAGGVAMTSAVAIGFVVIAISLGGVAIPPLFRVVERIRSSGALGTIAIAFALFLAWLAARGGSAMIIGAFAAGLILHPTPQRAEIERSATQLGFLFVPIFFASVGASVDIAALLSKDALLVGGALIVVGVLGKFAAGYAPWWFGGNKALVGVAMIPRGEVGLIFAQLGLASGVLEGGLFGALMLMVVVTTFVTPPLLGHLARRTNGAATERDQSGIDDLVSGSRPQH